MKNIIELWQKTQHVVFDWNGTLIDDVDLAVESMSVLSRRCGLQPIDREQYRETFCFPISTFYKSLGFDFELIAFSELMQQYLLLFNSRVTNCQLRRGTNRLLGQIRRTRRGMSILSATLESTLIETVQHKQIAHYFEHIIGSVDEAAVGKLERARNLQDRLGVASNSILLIGDTTHDVEVARALGWNAIVLHGGHEAENRCVIEGVHRSAGFETLSAALESDFA